MPNASDFLVAAGELDRSASWLGVALDPLATFDGPHVWRGPVADRFAGELDDQRRRLRAISDELRLAARQLMVDAEQLALPPDPASNWLQSAGRPF